jgi:hypothetical protein
MQSRWNLQGVGSRPEPRRRARRRSRDPSGPLPARVVRSLVDAIKSMLARGPWPKIDEEAWWSEVLTDSRLHLPTAKRLENKTASFRLDQQTAEALTFSCERCSQQTTVAVADLIRTFGRDRNVRTVGQEVLKCPNKRARREGYGCPVTYRA